MPEALKVFRLAFSTILFCVGIALLIYTSAIYTDTLSNVRNCYKDREVYQQNNANSGVISYAELISTLCNKPEYDTVVNGITIKKSTFDPENIKYYDIPAISYTKSYRYDNNGNIMEIIYTELSD